MLSEDFKRSFPVIQSIQPNSNLIKDGEETIKQAYNSLLKNNFIPQQPNTLRSITGN